MSNKKTLVVKCKFCNTKISIHAIIGIHNIVCPNCHKELKVRIRKPRPYNIINLQQRSPKWLTWRRQGIGASDAAVIMGESPWKTRETLLKEKVQGEIIKPNKKMLRGIKLEPKARDKYIKFVGQAVYPVCIQSKKYNWLRASIDGLSNDGKLVVEIKCGDSVYKKTASSRKVPHYYIGQLQHILAITGLPSIDFWCYLPLKPIVHLHIRRDNNYIQQLIKKEYYFWKDVLEYRKY